MKKSISIVAVLIFAMLQLKAQDEVKKFRFGLKGAPSLSWFKPDVKGLENAGMGFGFNYGLMTDFGMGSNGNYAFATGFEVSTLGGKLKYPDVYQSTKDTTTTLSFGMNTRSYKLTYVNLPIQLKLKTNEIGYMTYYGSFGFELGFNIKSRANDELDLRKSMTIGIDTIAVSLNNPQIVTNDDIDLLHKETAQSGEIQPFRVALVVGGGFEYNLSGNTSIMVGVSYNNGFTNVLRNRMYEKSSAYEGPALENGVLKQTSDQYNIPTDGSKLKATSNYFALNIGIFF